MKSPPDITGLSKFNSADDAIIKVLLVDDHVVVAGIIRHLLAIETSIEFHYCATAQHALSAAIDILPNVILQDLIMPGIDGFTLVQQYRSNPATRDIPIIVLSSEDDPAVKSVAFAMDVSDYLVKPPDSIELIARIRHHARSYMNLQQRNAAYRALREKQQQLVSANMELQRLSKSDGLTGLANRRYFDEYLGIEWKRAIRDQSELSFLMIDIDDFKRYNDAYGHVAGDGVLKRVADIVQTHARRPTDLAARLGGEEFVIILPNTTRASGNGIAQALQQAIYDLHITHCCSANSDRVTVSIGCASITPQQMDEMVTLVETADQALYVAKRTGKNRVEVAQ
ncbi:GGDEF domain-containing response regulator [Glaciimonas soli]|uniref:diguanylate cyclase n=1 Tax=Glaciimonas soli TaxID=2590999 RepID=A0A843YP01_9BURK|nr:diguanylate cyclase [Glaciimonas soli]MQR01205.1 diguanylate cyclase [Glaciimonas soli]